MQNKSTNSEPNFQIFECINQKCRLRFPSDLTTKRFDRCPVCGSMMNPVGEAYRNFQREPDRQMSRHQAISILLDNLRSAENVGSIFRTANGAGVKHIYCCGTTPTPQHARVKKSSLGAEAETSWSYHPNSLDTARDLKKNGSHLIGLESTSTSRSILDFSFTNYHSMSLVLILGNEVSGIDPEVFSYTDNMLHIPMAGSKTSLNVAVAAGIALYLLVKSSSQPTE